MKVQKIRCGSCKGTHATAAKVRECHTEARGGYLDLREFDDQQAAEVWAENAWLRHAEGWYRNPDPEEYLDRMAEAYGYGPPGGVL